MTCPSGCNKGAIKYILTKSRAWRDMIKAGKLSRCYIWFMMEKQVWLWPRVLASPVCHLGLVQGTLGMPHEHIL